MEGLRVAELAELAGIAPSAVRFYERMGLLSRARRAGNGYRLFDASALDELAFIGRAKGIGMSLEDIAELVTAWPNTECRLLQARLRGFLDERISQVGAQRAELEAFEAQLRGVLSRLSGRDPGPELCGKGCGCEEDLDVTAPQSHAAPRAWGCSLDDAELGDRIGEWRRLAAAAITVEHDGDTVRLVLASDADQIGAAARLCVAEAACCAPIRFTIEIAAEQTTVTAQAPGGVDVLDALFPTDVWRRR